MISQCKLIPSDWIKGYWSPAVIYFNKWHILWQCKEQSTTPAKPEKVSCLFLVNENYTLILALLWQDMLWNPDIVRSSSLWETKNICDLLLNNKHIPVPQNRWRREETDEREMTVLWKPPQILWGSVVPCLRWEQMH